MNVRDVLKKGKQFVIGMVHCLPLPGTVGYGGDMQKIIDQAVGDAKILEENGVNAIIVENMGDSPFAVVLDTAQRIALAIITQKIRDMIHIPVGVDAAFCDYEASISIAKITGCQFVRIPVFVDSVEFYGGIIKPCARECMLYRKSLDAEDIMVLADLQVKHTNMVLPHVKIEQSARNALDCGADAIIVTGSALGVETPIDMIKRVQEIAAIPVIAGSGVNARNIKEQLSIADGAIIGSSLKEGGVISNPISGPMVKEVLNGLHS
jgi:membrane complex biogenesis BtpA family protein